VGIDGCGVRYCRMHVGTADVGVHAVPCAGSLTSRRARMGHGVSSRRTHPDEVVSLLLLLLLRPTLLLMG
jgi:hypothetical protein